MSRAPDVSAYRRDSVTVPKIAVAIALSALLHAIVFWRWLPDLHPPGDPEQPRDSKGPLIVQLAPPPKPQRAPPPAPRPRPPRPAAQPAKPAVKPPAPAPKAAPRPAPRAPVLALDKSAPSAAPRPSTVPPTTPKPLAPPSSADLLAYVESQRRARNLVPPTPAPQPPSRPSQSEEDANARANRLAAANLGLDRKPVFGERKRGGGVFEIERMGYDSAEFLFYGWNREIRRNTTQLIEVRKGSNSDIQIAVIRRMIEIIRDYEKGDFIWESQRLGRNVTLSARQRDNAGLEDFLMREFFDKGLAPARR